MSNVRSYFAAANGYGGFRSNFPEIFNPDLYEKMYILKGGPGTGKSTLMRTIVRKLESEDVDITQIFCSSDPGSLDAVIVKNESTTVAVLDGTAPHSHDPKYPGACETLVNLGDGFKTELLYKHRGEITELSKEKSNAYAQAYEYLRTAGELYKCISSLLVKNKVYKKAEAVFAQFLEFSKKSDPTALLSDKYLLSAFGKAGHTTLNINEPTRKTIRISGDGFSERVLMNILSNRLLKSSQLEQLCPSALNESEADALYTEDHVFTVNNYGDTVVDTYALVCDMPREYNILKGMHESLLELSSEKFTEASMAHSRLEDIYSHSIDFKNNRSITERIFAEICNILLQN